MAKKIEKAEKTDYYAVLGDTAVLAGYKHVEALLPKADGGGVFPTWHGWALREAFWDGILWARENEHP